jgi:hypothetical protein
MAQHPGSIWLDNNWSTLPNNLWVAATGSGLVEENRSFDRLINALRHRNINLDDVTIVFVTFDILQ